MHLWQIFWEAFIELFDEHLCPLLEFFEILIAPPVLQEAIAIIFRTLVIKAMANLMADG